MKQNYGSPESIIARAEAEDLFKEAIIKSSVSTDVKVKLLDYLTIKQSAEGIKMLASIIFDYFKNAKETLEKSAGEVSVEDLKTLVMAELTPSIMEYEDEQVNLLITLIIKEYILKRKNQCHSFGIGFYIGNGRQLLIFF